MHAEITGTTLPVLQIHLNKGERVISETGELSWKDPHVTMETSMGGAGSRGLLGAIGRSLSGSSMFMTEYSAPDRAGMVAFAARIPGQILEQKVTGRKGYLIHRNGFVCGTPEVILTTELTNSIGAGFFGGNGFTMQKVSGDAVFWVELGGEVVTRTLEPGESLDVHPGHVGMFESSVTFDVRVLPGLKNKLFGKDGLFLAHLTGPGKIWLQTLTLPNLAGALAPYMKSGG